MIIKFNTYLNENKYDNVSFDTINSLVKNGMINIVKDYLDNSGDVNLRDPISNETLLMTSLKLDNSDMFDLLLSYNPDLTIKTKYNGETILFSIIEDYIPLYKKGFIDIIKKVLEKDITILEIEDSIGDLPVDFAALHSSYALFELLKFKPNLRDCSFFDNISDGVINAIQKTFKDQYNYCLKKRKSRNFNL
jgi:ankyrin repeat protein